MTYAIITYEECIAGQNMKKHLLSLFDFKDTGEKFEDNPVYSFSSDGRVLCRLYTTKTKHIICEHIDSRIPEEKIIFATTHRSEKGVVSLCVHVPGNWNRSDLGGEEKFICTAMPFEMRTALLEMQKLAASSDFEVTIEATHHGPAVEKPVMFIEIGSSDEHWHREDAGIINAKTIMHVIECGANQKQTCADAHNETSDKHTTQYDKANSSITTTKSVVVLGGGHYNQVANKIISKTDYAVGHICPKYALEKLTPELLQDAIAKTPGFEMVVLDWKGLGGEKQHIVEMLDALEVKYERWKNLFKEQKSEK